MDCVRKMADHELIHCLAGDIAIDVIVRWTGEGSVG